MKQTGNSLRLAAGLQFGFAGVAAVCVSAMDIALSIEGSRPETGSIASNLILFTEIATYVATVLSGIIFLNRRAYREMVAESSRILADEDRVAAASQPAPGQSVSS